MRLKRKGRLLLVLGLVFLVQAGGISWSQVTERVSVDSFGVEGDDSSTDPSNSSDGRYVAFESFATNLVGVGNDNNNRPDVFVHDLQTGATTRVSVGLAGAEGDDSSTDPSISADSRYVAFESFATNLVGVGNDNNGFSDVFVHDRQTGATTRVSVDSAGVEGIGASFDPSISSDGGYVAFESDVDFVLNDVALWDVYVHDRQTGATTLVSVDSGGAGGNDNSGDPSISSNGRYVAFESKAIDLVPLGSNGLIHIFVHDRDTDGDGQYDEAGSISTVQVSVDSAGAEGIGGDSSSCSISGDGRYVAFVSAATNLVANDTNGFFDVFVHDRDADDDGQYDEAGEISTVRVSVDSAGAEGDNNSNFPSISSDGRYVAFESISPDLVAGDGNGFSDVFVHDRDADGNGAYDEPGAISTVRVSVDLDGVEGNKNSNFPSMSADGKSVTFQSDADNLVAGDTLGFPDIFVDDLQAGAGGGGGGGSSSGGGGCFIATAADGSGMAGEVK